MDLTLLHKVWERALRMARSEGALSADERRLLLEGRADEPVRGKLLARLLAHGAGSTLLRGNPETVSADDLLRAEAGLASFLQDLDSHRTDESWMQQLTPFLDRFRQMSSATPAGASPNLLRSEGTGEQALRLLTPVGVVPAFPYTFVWTPVPGVSSYAVELFDADLETLHESVVDQPQLAYPPELPEPSPARPFSWRVSTLGEPLRRHASAQVFPQAVSSSAEEPNG